MNSHPIYKLQAAAKDVGVETTVTAGKTPGRHTKPVLRIRFIDLPSALSAVSQVGQLLESEDADQVTLMLAECKSRMTAGGALTLTVGASEPVPA